MLNHVVLSETRNPCEGDDYASLSLLEIACILGISRLARNDSTKRLFKIQLTNTSIKKTPHILGK
jgi:hypothetical protein